MRKNGVRTSENMKTYEKSLIRKEFGIFQEQKGPQILYIVRETVVKDKVKGMKRD